MVEVVTNLRMNRARPAIPWMVLVFMCLVAAPGWAKFVTITEIPKGIPKELAFGEIVREIRIEGNKYTREDIIRMALKSQVHHPYTQEHARLDLLWVGRLGAFTSVTFATEPYQSQPNLDGITLVVIVTEGSPYIPSLSMALTQENGFEIGPAVSSSNLLGTAARASIYARFGGATNIGIKYAEPELPVWNIRNGHKFEYFHRERTNELLDFGETTDEIFYELKQPSTEEVRGGFRFRYMALKSDTDGITLGADNYDHMPSFGLFIQSDSRNAIYPTNGWYMDLEGAKYGIFGGDADFWRLDLDLRRYVPLSFVGKRHSLAFSTLASFQAGEIGVNIPEYQEFFVGGTNSVRGWSLGARQGQNQWLTTVEYWFQLMEQKAWKIWFIKWRMGFQIGGFFDFGTAWNGYQDMEQNMIGGGGLGLRLTLPVVTMFRVDLAVGEDDFGVRVFIGGGEKAMAQKNRVR